MEQATVTNDISMQSQAGTDQYLTFLLGKEEYGVNILRVQEIRGWESATSIPNTPEFILGVINLRGIVVPILDLRIRFGLEDRNFDATTVVVVVKVEQKGSERIVGMVVDAVSEVYNVSEDMMRETPDMGGAINTDFVKGLATIDEKMIILLDVDLLIEKGILENIKDVKKEDARKNIKVVKTDAKQDTEEEIKEAAEDVKDDETEEAAEDVKDEDIEDEDIKEDETEEAKE